MSKKLWVTRLIWTSFACCPGCGSIVLQWNPSIWERNAWAQWLPASTRSLDSFRLIGPCRYQYFTIYLLIFKNFSYFYCFFHLGIFPFELPPCSAYTQVWRSFLFDQEHVGKRQVRKDCQGIFFFLSVFPILFLYSFFFKKLF
jgi:hypothetical protein